MSKMETMKATPGPWTMTPPTPGDKDIYIDAEGDGWNRLGCTVTRDDCDTETALANAHLITAAPELLECMEELFARPGVDVYLGGNPHAIERLRVKCMAAIAKATGAPLEPVSE